MNRLAIGVLLAAVCALAPACGSVDRDAGPGQEPQGPTETPPPNGSLPPAESPSGERCSTPEPTRSVLADAQFAFTGTVASAEPQVHPWTTDPENPSRSAEIETTRWVTFTVDGWYTADWGPVFSVWMPTIAVDVGDRLAVGGDAYHTEVAGFSGQSGEVEFCALLPGPQASLPAWDDFFGASTPPGPVLPDPVDVPAVDGTKVFGEQSGPCPASVARNGPDDEQILADGSSCLLAEVSAGRPVVWDVVVPTVEGDPIPSRYVFDGDTLTITTDYSFDHFGTPGVHVVRCRGVREATFQLPEGVDCVPSNGDGFRADSMPYGT